MKRLQLFIIYADNSLSTHDLTDPGRAPDDAQAAMVASCAVHGQGPMAMVIAARAASVLWSAFAWAWVPTVMS